jgi:hypothetical protein
MKRILGIALVLASMGLADFAVAKANNETSPTSVTVAANAAPQWQQDRYGRRVYTRRRVRQVTQYRTVRYGRRLYRETYVVRYLPNGQTDTRLVSRVRIS